MTVDKEMLFNVNRGEYFTHKFLSLVGKNQAQHLYEVLEEYKSLNTLKVAIVDNTITNRGHKTGIALYSVTFFLCSRKN